MSTNNDETISDEFSPPIKHYKQGEKRRRQEKLEGMVIRQLVHEVLSLNPEHKTSKVILDLVYEALQNHLHIFESSSRLTGDNVKAEFSKIVREMFSDGIRHWGRIAVMFAFAIFLQQRFKVDLEEETVTLTEDLLSDWMEVQGGWNEATSGIGNGFRLSFIHYLVGTTCLLLLLDNCCRLH